MVDIFAILMGRCTVHLLNVGRMVSVCPFGPCFYECSNLEILVVIDAVLTILYLQQFLVIFSTPTLISFIKLKIRWSFLGAEQV